jgi:anaerobic magnesium-protoporphyrin IX monomethyl ester cyclase
VGRMPNLGLCSIAANLDKELCSVKVVDLVVMGRKARGYLRHLVTEYEPDVVGFSCMVFQYTEALELAKMVKTVNGRIKVVMGGYGPTVICDKILDSDDMDFVDFVIRGEGEIAFSELVKALQRGSGFDDVPGLSYRCNGSTYHNPVGPLVDLDELELPDRDARILKKGFHVMGYPAETAETSRGCAYGCKYCTIREMYGKSFRRFRIERVIQDLRDVEKRGARAVFIVDDNVTLNGDRYRELCEAIVDAKLQNLGFMVQASVRGLKKTPGLIDAMAGAGTGLVFLGIENESEDALEFMNKAGLFTNSDAYDVVRELRSSGIIVIGGIILGYPDDTEESIRANFEYVKRLGVDHCTFMILTPYPGTAVREELIRQGLVTNLNDFSKYTAYTACIRTKHISAERLHDLRDELGTRFPGESGGFLRWIKKAPKGFIVKLVLSQLFTQPRDVLGYTKGLLRKG